MMEPRSIDIKTIRKALEDVDLLEIMSDAFIAHSSGRSVIPPVGELLVDGPPAGEVHIKYGYVRGGRHYVVKIASGFPENDRSGLPSGNGMMLLFDLRTGALSSILHDEGHLTDVRTAAAGALVSRVLSPMPVDAVGILGTGVQARLQAIFAVRHLGCRRVVLWGRNDDHVRDARQEIMSHGIRVDRASSVDEVTESCRLIITCTSATTPLIGPGRIRPGTHVTAVGSDTPEKQELDCSILESADLVVVDSIPQSVLRGEVSRAIKAGLLKDDRIVEIGSILNGSVPGRISDDQVTVADLTGVAVQDLAIAEAISDLCDGG